MALTGTTRTAQPRHMVHPQCQFPGIDSSTVNGHCCCPLPWCPPLVYNSHHFTRPLRPPSFCPSDLQLSLSGVLLASTKAPTMHLPCSGQSDARCTKAPTMHLPHNGQSDARYTKAPTMQLPCSGQSDARYAQ